MGLRSTMRLTVLVAVLASAGVCVSSATGLESPPPLPDNMYADDKLVPREIKRQFKQRQEREAKRTTDAAKADRKASRTRYKDKSNREALAIARGKFEHFLDAPTFTGLTLAPGEKVKHYVDDFQALIQVGDGPDEVALVESDLPLRTPAGEPTDLSLEAEGDGFAPKAATVELDLPGDLADGVGMADGRVRIKPVTDAETQATETGDKVFYGNAQTDADVLVKPTARGFESFTQLRSAESPEQIAFDVEVAGGATLRRADAAIEVVSPGGKKIATISPPRAVAADGEPVEVGYAIDGMRVTMDVAHRDRDVAYPILVDPDVIYEDWVTTPWATSNRDQYGWATSSWASHPECTWKGTFGGGSWTYGRLVYHYDGNYCNVDNWAQWTFQAPRASYIYRAEFHYQNHQNRFTCAVNGLWDPWRSNWDAGWVWVYCGDLWNHRHDHCPIYNDCNVDYGSPSNIAVFKVQICCGPGRRTPGARAELGGALLYLRDRENPVIDATNHNTDSRWYRSGTMTVKPKAHDDGLGMNKFQLYIPGFVDDYRRHPCIRSRCPHYWELPNDGQGIFSYNIPDIPNGINSVTLNARDALDKIAGASWSLNVDDEQPWLNVYGPLREAANEGTFTGSKQIWINSDDNLTPYNGSSATARSGIASVEILVDGVRRFFQTQNCFANCRLDTNWLYSAEAYSSGSHTVQVIARDGAGNEKSSSTWTIRSSSAYVPDDELYPANPADDGSAPTDDDGAYEASCLQDPEYSDPPYCGEGEATTTAEQKAAADPPLISSDIFGMPKIAAGAREWGFSHQGPEDIGDPRAENLRPHDGDPATLDDPGRVLRVMVPWDLLYRATEPRTYYVYNSSGGQTPYDVPAAPGALTAFEEYFDRAKAYGYEVMISFTTTSATLGTNDKPFKLGARVIPSVAKYMEEVTKIINHFRARGSEILYVAPFNEPNHRPYSTSGSDLSHPHLVGQTKVVKLVRDKNKLRTFPAGMVAGAKRAADYYDALRTWCVSNGCSVVAGDFADTDTLKQYLPLYTNYMDSYPPKRWALHTYVAGETQNSGLVRWFLEKTGGTSSAKQVWLTEQGALYSGKGEGNTYQDGVNNLAFLLRLPSISTRITRFYHYALRGDWEDKNNDGRNERHDSGLLNPNPDPAINGQIRPTYCTYGQKTNPAAFPASRPWPECTTPLSG